MFVEEISDKVVSNVIENVQEEVQKDNPLLQKIATQVLLPKKDKIDKWLNDKISETITLTYYKHRYELNDYLQTVVRKSVNENPEIKRITLIPGLGKQIALALESSISNITFNVVDNAIEDMAKNRHVPAVEDITGHLLGSLSLDHPQNEDLNILMKQIVHDTLEMVKRQVEIKMWLIKEMEEEKAYLSRRISNGRGNIEALQARIQIIDEELVKMQNLEQ